MSANRFFFSIITTVALSACGARHEDPSLALRLDARESKELIVVLTSTSGTQIVDKTFAFRNSAGRGNLVLFFVDEEGASYPSCGFIDPPSDFDSDAPLEPRAGRKSVLSLKLVKSVYCLPPGKYTVSATYADHRRHHVTSSAVPLQIK